MSYSVYEYICINPECNYRKVIYETDREGMINLYCSKCGEELQKVKV